MSGSTGGTVTGELDTRYLARGTFDLLFAAAANAVYVCWDQLALAMRRSRHYPALRLAEDRPRRRTATVFFLLAYAALAGIVLFLDPRDRHIVGVLDVVLAAGLVAHRFVQDRFLRSERRPVADAADEG